MGVQLHMTNIYYHWVQNRGILAKKSPFSGKMFWKGLHSLPSKYTNVVSPDYDQFMTLLHTLDPL